MLMEVRGFIYLFGLVTLVAGLFIVGALAVNDSNRRAMEKCLETQSSDTCNYILQR